ncbi:MAG: saccharopine dehydrogenase [Cytophagales bacterium]|nr:saccharopine dehydrogenase [Cytophagales bacterium]
MKNILILGAGRSASTLIQYLLNKSMEFDWRITVASRTIEKAKRKLQKCGTAITFDVLNEVQRKNEIQNADIVISMLPVRFHHLVASDCVEFRKNMITASYVTTEIRELDAVAKKNGNIILMEMGVDPGIDHMSAKKVIDKIKEDGGVLTLFKSFTGGLIAPEFDNNPWHYKFTWNPRNVVLAGQQTVKYKKNGMYKYVPTHRIFSRIEKVSVLNYGDFEAYPNRDSLRYRDKYDLEDIQTIFRGTLRRPGFCNAWKLLVQIGLTDDSITLENSEQMTYRDLLNTFLAYATDISVEKKLCKYLRIDEGSEEMKKLIWLGLFDKKKIGLSNVSPARILQHLLEQKWQMDQQDKDMIVMQHQFEYELNGNKKTLISSMVTIGDDTVQTAMAKTVGLPLGIAAKLILTGKIALTGVQIPTVKEIYEPVLDELEGMGINFVEEEMAQSLEV